MAPGLPGISSPVIGKCEMRAILYGCGACIELANLFLLSPLVWHIVLSSGKGIALVGQPHTPPAPLPTHSLLLVTPTFLNVFDIKRRRRAIPMEIDVVLNGYSLL